MRQREFRPLDLPVGVLTLTVLVLTALCLFVADLPPAERDGNWTWALWPRVLAVLGVLAVLAAASLFFARNQAWPGRLYLLAVQFYLLGALILVADAEPDPEPPWLFGSAAALCLLIGLVVIHYEERFLRAAPSAGSERPKCAACSTPLAVRSRVAPWPMLLVGDALLAFGAYRFWLHFFALGDVSLQASALLIAAQLVGAALVAYWLLVRKFWWQCSGCGNEGRPRTGVRAQDAPPSGVTDKSFGRLMPPDPAQVCPVCGGLSHAQQGLMRAIAGLSWFVGIAAGIAGGWMTAGAIGQGRPAGFLFGTMLFAGGIAMFWFGGRYFAARRAARRCELCARCFLASPRACQK